MGGVFVLHLRALLATICAIPRFRSCSLHGGENGIVASPSTENRSAYCNQVLINHTGP
jgi:hypothetical protein